MFVARVTWLRRECQMFRLDPISHSRSSRYPLLFPRFGFQLSVDNEF